MYEKMNQSTEFEIYEPVVLQEKPPSSNQCTLIYKSDKVGQIIAAGSKSVTLVQPLALASSFTTNKTFSINISSSIHLEKFDKAKKTA